MSPTGAATIPSHGPSAAAAIRATPLQNGTRKRPRVIFLAASRACAVTWGNVISPATSSN